MVKVKVKVQHLNTHRDTQTTYYVHGNFEIELTGLVLTVKKLREEGKKQDFLIHSSSKACV